MIFACKSESNWTTLPTGDAVPANDSWYRCCCEGPWFCWPLAGTWTKDYHDWNPDRSPVVHLRWREGSAPSSPSTSPRDACLPEGQDGCCSVLDLAIELSLRVDLPKRNNTIKTQQTK